MTRYWIVIGWIFITCGTLVGQALGQSGGSTPEFPIDFNRQIRPILSDRCYACHGPDQAANESGLRLDIESEAIDAGAWVAGKPDESSIIDRIESEDDDLLMPPADSHLQLSDAEKKLLRRWIEEGAKYDAHWAFKKIPTSVAVPPINGQEDQSWVRNPIDHFVLDRLKKENLRPAPAAGRHRWLRRVTFDLTGLPPTAEEINNFLSDNDNDAFEKVVDRLLASKDYGRRVATVWLDAVRYADSYGYQADLLSPTWPYRDWVVDAINENLPYDDFLLWQIAGDMLPKATRQQKLATAFNRLHRQTNEGGSVQLEWQTEYVADRVQTFSAAVLGLTMECARCHDHKYDPISQQDFYNLSSFFNSIDEWGTYHDSSRVPTPSLLLPSQSQEAAGKELAGEWKRLRTQLDQRQQSLLDDFDDWLETFRLAEAVPKPKRHWPLDNLESGNQLPNKISDNRDTFAGTSPANKIVPGRIGNGLQLSGDDAVNFKIDGNLSAWQRYSVSFFLKIPEDLQDGVVLHRQSGTDVGYFGTALQLKNGKLRFANVRFWPGNALAVETRQPVPTEQWTHVTVSCNGSGTADGLRIFVDGVCNNVILRNCLTKDPGAGGSGFTIGQGFRRRGLKNGLIDEVQFFDFPISSLQAQLLARPDHEFVKDDFSEREFKQHFLSQHEDLVSLSKQVADAFAKLIRHQGRYMETMVMEELSEPKPAYVLARGAYDAPRTDSNRAVRATPSALPAMDKQLSRDRLGLAQWVVSDDHPLTARVAVNRYWQMFFGRGLVTTPDDFGVQGSPPTHPELLDWLARDFIDNRWDAKRLVRQIVLSATYRQNSVCDAGLREKDPDNLLLARGPAKRLTAEMIRDMALFTSELLNTESGGPPVSPYQPKNLWRENNSMTPAYRQSVGKSLYRRSLYSVWKRTAPLPNMISFDATTREVCTVRRSETNTPLQAMILLNDPQFVEAARVLAERAIQIHSDSIPDRIQLIFVRLTGRNPLERESRLLEDLYRQQVEIFSSQPEQAARFANAGESPSGQPDAPVDVAATSVVAQAILSLDATIWNR